MTRKFENKHKSSIKTAIPNPVYNSTFIGWQKFKDPLWIIESWIFSLNIHRFPLRLKKLACLNWRILAPPKNGAKYKVNWPDHSLRIYSPKSEATKVQSSTTELIKVTICKTALVCPTGAQQRQERYAHMLHPYSKLSLILLDTYCPNHCRLFHHPFTLSSTAATDGVETAASSVYSGVQHDGYATSWMSPPKWSNFYKTFSMLRQSRKILSIHFSYCF